MLRNRNLIVARCGKSSLHREWLKGGPRNWDLMLCPYEPIDEDEIPMVLVPGQKWHGMHRFFSVTREWLNYEYICVPDDDLAADAPTWSKFFDICAELGAKLAAPAMTPDSHFSHLITMQNTSFRARRTTFVECGLACMRRDFLIDALPTMRMTKLGAGVGIDLVWPSLLEYQDIWIVDETPVRHTRPVGSNYSDMYRALFNYDLRFVRGMGIPWELQTLGGYLTSNRYVSSEEPEFAAALQSGLSYLPADHPKRAEGLGALNGGLHPPKDVVAESRLAAALFHVKLGDGTISRGKPAMVSSISPWSWCHDRALEASGANDGLINGSFGFHTAEEIDPWWEVDLLYDHCLSQVVVYNRLDQRRRCLHFDIQISQDRQNWRTIFSKRDDYAFGGIDGDPLRVDFVSRVVGRFVRLQARGHTCLHLDQVEIFGSQADASEAAPTPSQAPQFSLTESAELEAGKTEFVLVSKRRTVVTLEPTQGRLWHLPVTDSLLNVRLTLPDDYRQNCEDIRFTVLGTELVLKAVGDAWALCHDGAFASTRADTIVQWHRDVSADDLFDLVPAAYAVLLSPLGERATPAKTSARRRVMIIAPWVVVGGADKVNLDLVTGLRPDLDITFVTTLGAGAWASRFEAQVERLIFLGQFLPPQSYGAALVLLIRRLGIECVLMSNSQAGYEALPTLRQNFPALPMFDLLHGQGGDAEGGGYPAFSVQFDGYLTGRIVVTEYLRDLMTTRYGIAAGRITRIYNGVDLDFFVPVERRESARPIVSFIGRLASEKHPEHVVAIAKALAGSAPCHFKIAGDGPLQVALAQMLAEDPPPHPVELLGHVEDVRALLGETSVLLLTSEMEGFPIIVLEAMAMGVPVICSAVGGVPEMVRDGIDGFLVPYGPEFAVVAARRLQELLTRPERRLAMGLSARKRVEAEFALPTMIERYRALLTGRREVSLDATSDAPIQRSYAGVFHVQKLKVRDVPYRVPYLKSLVAGRRVLHVGCTDFPIFDPQANLHIQLKDDCAILDGLDTDRAGIGVLSEYVKGRYFTRASDVSEQYDLLIVPETIEHVHNIQEFLAQLHTIDFREIVITAPCLIGWNHNFNYADRAGRLSSLLAEPQDYIEEVHPDHKAWFTPYTLANCVEQFTSWHIKEVLFLDGKRMAAVHCSKRAPVHAPAQPTAAADRANKLVVPR